VYASVLQSGKIQRGDSIGLEISISTDRIP